MPFTADMADGFRVPTGATVHLSEWNTRWEIPADLQGLDRDTLKQQAADFVADRAREVARYQDLLWADGRRTLLIIFQGMDGSGKDSTIKRVTSGMNPAGVRVVSFGVPTPEELKHHYLWRYVNALPPKGMIGIFNRSYYEDVGVVRVFPELVKNSHIPDRPVDTSFWNERYADICHLERQLVRNGTVILKFFLHISRDEQRQRLLARLQDPAKHWKYDASDFVARGRWDDFQHAYESMITHTNTEEAPWWIMPADRKWAMRALVAQATCNSVSGLELRYPPVDPDKHAEISGAIETLKGED